MGKYSKLTSYLICVVGNEVTMTFAQIDELVDGKLPDSAFKHRPWWANQKKGNRSQSEAWQSAGWETSDVDMSKQSLTFVRTRDRNESFERAENYASASKSGLSILDAKIGLAEFYNVKPENIEIHIRG
jgi:hypothetical protein